MNRQGSTYLTIHSISSFPLTALGDFASYWNTTLLLKSGAPRCAEGAGRVVTEISGSSES